MSSSSNSSLVCAPTKPPSNCKSTYDIVFPVVFALEDGRNMTSFWNATLNNSVFSTNMGGIQGATTNHSLLPIANLSQSDILYSAGFFICDGGYLRHGDSPDFWYCPLTTEVVDQDTSSSGNTCTNITIQVQDYKPSLASGNASCPYKAYDRPIPATTSSSPTYASTSTRSQSSGTASSAVSPTTTAQPQSSQSMPLAATVGAVAGGVVVLVLLIFSVWCCMRRRKQTVGNKLAGSAATSERALSVCELPEYGSGKKYSTVHEFEAVVPTETDGSQIHEVAGGPHRHEAGGDALYEAGSNAVYEMPGSTEYKSAEWPLGNNQPRGGWI